MNEQLVKQSFERAYLNVAGNLKNAGIEQYTVDLKLKYGFKDLLVPLRMYEYCGMKGLSVTTALQCFQKFELQEWKERSTKESMAERKKETAGLGTEAHSLIEQEAKGETVQPKEELKEWFDEWKKTEKQFDITSEYSEVRVFSKSFLYGGTIDRIGMFNGKRSIIDFKSGSYSHSHLWTTEAYRQAYGEMTGDWDTQTIVLMLPRPDLIAKGAKPRHYTVSRHTQCFTAFLSCYFALRMMYGKELCEAGMDKERVYENLPFMLYEREYGKGFQKEMEGNE